MVQYLVIVESPAKISKIQSFLGNNYIVKASFGHITDLDNKTLSIDINTMRPEYKIIQSKITIISELKKLSKKYETIIATDKDTEGEAIGYHLSNVLKLTNPKRIIFTEITQSAIDNALLNITTLNQNKINNQQTRRIIDRLIGFLLSPILWKNISHKYTHGECISVGRVQSIILKILSENITLIDNYTPIKNYNININISNNIYNDINIKLIEKINDEKLINKIIEKSKSNNFTLSNIINKQITIKPLLPFITSTLQQDANSRFHFTSKNTMMYAQKLYEHGLITYMRTDSTIISNNIQAEIKDYIINTYSVKYYNNTNIIKKSKSKKNIQEAHEAIRPTNILFDASTITDENELKLSNLIWNRTIASQMTPYIFDEHTYNFQIINYTKYNFTTKYNTIVFDGFRILYQPIIEIYDDDDEHIIENINNKLQNININDIFNFINLNCLEYYKKSPPRYTEGSLIKKLDTLAIGRPSTYSNLLSSILQKKYAIIGNIDGNDIKIINIIYDNLTSKLTRNTLLVNHGREERKIILLPLGKNINDFISLHFSTLINYDFTKNMEDNLDLIETGKVNWITITKQYYTNIMTVIESIQTTDIKSNNIILGYNPQNNNQIIKCINKFGPTIREDLGNNKYKYCKITTDFNKLTLDDAILLLKYPYTIFNYNNLPVNINSGIYGLYCLYDSKNYSLKGYNEESLTIDIFTKIINNSSDNNNGLIRKLNESVSIYNGIYGFYLSTKKKNYKIPSNYNIDNITLEICKEIIDNQPKKIYKKKVKV